jgi:undecaprenyl-diphosphatase
MLNEKIFNFLNSFVGKNPIFDGFIIFSARYLVILLLAFCLTLLFKISKKAIITFLLSLILALLASQLLRFFLPLDRPFVGREVNLLFYPSQDPSFPSNHAVWAGVSAFSLFLYQKKAGILAILMAILIGSARIFAGLHWPTDILAGLLLGLLASFAGKEILDLLELT